MTIDPEKLEEAINRAERAWRWTAVEDDERQFVILAAARAHLSTLPRVKEVEVVDWAVVGIDGQVINRGFSSEMHATDWGTRCWHDVTFPVRLTGTAKIKVPQ